VSSILKALEKLEQEKRAKRSTKQDIAAGVVRSNRKQKPLTGWLFPATIALTALVAVLVTYLIVRGPNSKPAATSVTATATPEAKQTSIPQNLLQGNEPIAPPQSAPSPVSPLLPRGTAPASSPLIPPPIVKQQAPQPSPPAATLSEPATPPPSPPQQPSLKVSGIAWQKDNSSRLAVVNGVAVSEGSSIEGAKVEEIFPDRVRFSAGGERFEIPLGRGR
jgi:general secretion pathway protein B